LAFLLSIYAHQVAFKVFPWYCLHLCCSTSNERGTLSGREAELLLFCAADPCEVPYLPRRAEGYLASPSFQFLCFCTNDATKEVLWLKNCLLCGSRFPRFLIAGSPVEVLLRLVLGFPSFLSPRSSTYAGLVLWAVRFLDKGAFFWARFKCLLQCAPPRTRVRYQAGVFR